jgi:hypothetical protein
VIYQKEFYWMGHVACMGETRNVDCSGDLDIEKDTNDMEVTKVLYSQNLCLCTISTHLLLAKKFQEKFT